MKPVSSHRLVAALAAALFLSVNGAQAANVTVSSISDLRTWAALSGNTVTMTPGTYYLNKADRSLYTDNPVVHFNGSDNTFDFTGVTLQIDNLYYDSNHNKMILRIWGTNNVLKNLTMTDVGSPTNSAAGNVYGGDMVKLGGVSNTLAGFALTGVGSKPYGYGSLFGKGAGALTPLYKKGGIYINGENCTVSNCTVIARFYGHSIYMQGAVNTTIDGCYVEGEMRRTDDILAETSGLAYDLNYMTVWGYPIPPDEVISCQEAGIRCYGSGVIDYSGDITRTTSNVTVRNCTVKKVREGITISDASGSKLVTGCVAMDCETGFQMSGGVITNCSGNFKHGPVFATYSGAHKNGVVTITVLHDEPTDGSHYMAYLTSSGIKLTLLSDGLTNGLDTPIAFGGSDFSVRYGEWSIDTANNNTLTNLTTHPVYLTPKASNNYIVSLGPVIDGGTGNFGGDFLPLFIPGTLQAESYSFMTGIVSQLCSDIGGGLLVEFSEPGDEMIFYVDVPSSGTYTAGFRVASATANITFDVADGPNARASVDRIATGGSQNRTTISKALYLRGGLSTLKVSATGGGWNMNWMSFNTNAAPPTPSGNLALNRISSHRDKTAIPTKLNTWDSFRS